MKTINSLIAMFLAVALVTPAVAGVQVPLKGSFAAVEIDVVQFPTLSASGSGTGNATLLGRYTATYTETVDLLTGSSVGAIILVAANGDSITASQIGQGIPTSDPNVASIIEVATITGGTGRFAGATGSFTVERLVDLTTGLTSGSLTGTISSPGNN